MKTRNANRFKQLGKISILALVMAFIAGCGDDADNISTTTNEGVVQTNLKASFVGRVEDALGNPLVGASIQLFANTTYEATTDLNGQYSIEVDMGGVVAASGGGASTTGATTYNDEGGDIDREFPMIVSSTGMASFRQIVEFNGTVGHTNGSGVVALISQIGNAIPLTVMQPYVKDFKFTVYAGSSPAADALVTLVPNGYPHANSSADNASYYAKTAVQLIADDKGVVTVSETDKVVAGAEFDVYVAPYDADKDGVYEYNASFSNKVFDLRILHHLSTSLLNYGLDSEGAVTVVQTEFAPSIYLQDGTNDLEVVYSSIWNNTLIPVTQASDLTFTIMFNRPVSPIGSGSIAGVGDVPLFSLTGKGDAPIPYTVTNTGNYLFVVTPDMALTPQNNTYNLTVNAASATSFNGGANATVALNQDFNIHDPTAMLTSAITPGLDIDDNTSYKADWDGFLVGAPSKTNPYTPSAVMYKANGHIKFSWAVDATATEYQIWSKDSANNPVWVKVEDIAGVTVNYTYNDGQFIEAVVQGIFTSAQYDNADDSLKTDTQAFFNSNTVQFVVTSKNINGLVLDPNFDTTIAGLSISDTWGPEVTAGAGWDATATTYTAATLCDAMGVNIAVDEPLKDVTLATTLASGTYGAKAAGSCATVKAVYWTDIDINADGSYPSNRGFIRLDLAPVVTTTTSAAIKALDRAFSVASTAGFAIEDSLSIDFADEGTIEGLYGNQMLQTNGIVAASTSGSTVYWRGAITPGYETVSGTLTSASDFLQNQLLLSDGDNIANGQSSILGEVVSLSAAAGGTLGAYGYQKISFANPLTTPIAPGASVGITSVAGAAGDLGAAADDGADDDRIGNTTLTAGVAIGATILPVDDANDFEADDALIIDFGNADQETVTVISTAVGSITISATVKAHIAGNTVHEPITVTKTTLGWPRVYVSNTTGMMLSTTLTATSALIAAETDTQTVLAILPEDGTSSSVILDDVLIDPNTFKAFTNLTPYTNTSMRTPDSLQVNLLDRSGNDSSKTDVDGDGSADRDQIGYEEVGVAAFATF
jgi:hypothetical protein